MGIDLFHALGFLIIPPSASEFETPIPDRYLADSENLRKCSSVKKVSLTPLELLLMLQTLACQLVSLKEH